MKNNKPFLIAEIGINHNGDIKIAKELAGMQFLTQSIDKMSKAIGVPSVGKIIDKEIPIAQKLRAHIKK